MNDRHPALEAARAALGEARDQLGTAADPRDTRALATTVGRLLLAVEAIVAYLDRPPGESDRATNSAVVDETMPPGGPHFDRARPHRGYGQD